MTFAVKKQEVYDNRVYDIESVTLSHGQAFADATYKIYGITHQLEDDDIRLELAKRVRRGRN